MYTQLFYTIKKHKTFHYLKQYKKNSYIILDTYVSFCVLLTTLPKLAALGRYFTLSNYYTTIPN